MTTIHAATDDTGDTVAQLRQAVTGRVVTPDDHADEAARTLFYGGLDRRPAVVVYPADTDDVARVVRLAAAPPAPFLPPRRRSSIPWRCSAMYEDPAERATHRAWVERHAAALAEGAPARYVNFLGDDTADGARTAYPPDTWDRLAAIKVAHDPANLFRHNVNVPPATT